MRTTIAMQLHVQPELLDRLDKKALERIHEASKDMSLVEWNRTPRGREFMHKIEFDPAFRMKPTHEINRIQREWYRQDVPARRGRTKLHDARVEIITEALEAYLTEKAA